MAKKAPPDAGTQSKPLNRSLHAAKATKQDEFYTQLSDIEKELRHYATEKGGTSRTRRSCATATTRASATSSSTSSTTSRSWG